LPLLIVFVFLLAMSVPESLSAQMTQIQQINEDKKPMVIYSIRFIYVPVLCVIIVSFCIWKQYPVYVAYKEWQNNRVYYALLYTDSSHHYESLYPYLNDQLQFLFEYSRSLSMSEQPEKSNEVLKRAIKISCDPMLYNIMGKNFQAMQQFEKAEQCFIKSSYLVPNRIYPHYLLMKLYIEIGENEKAKASAIVVLTKEPKVMSTAVLEMRQEAEIVNSRGDPCGRPNNYGHCSSSPQ